jgi:superfamily I DNA/RNA helicase
LTKLTQNKLHRPIISEDTDKNEILTIPNVVLTHKKYIQSCFALCGFVSKSAYDVEVEKINDQVKVAVEDRFKANKSASQDALHQLSERLNKEHSAELNKLMDHWGIKFPPKKIVHSGPQIVQSEALKINDSLIANFDRELELYGKNNLSPEQRKMLYSPSSATNVIAGAGAGKSTVLCLRVLFMNLHLGIDLSKISVTTFTRESRKDFVKKLQALYLLWGRDYSEQYLRGVVRTFHSIAYEVNKRLNGDGRTLIFGDKTPKISPEDIYGASIDDPTLLDDEDVEEVDDTVDKMSDILSDVYENIYRKVPQFRLWINELFLASRMGQKYNDFSLQLNEYALTYEPSIYELMLEDWKDKHADYLNSLPTKYFKYGEVRCGKSSLKYHLYLDNLKAKVFLGRAPDYFGTECIPNIKGNKKIAPVLKAREKIVNHCMNFDYVWVNDPEELAKLVEIDQYEINPQINTINAPSFNYTMEGEFRAKEGVNIYQQFYSLIQFVYSMGKSLNPDILNAVQQHFGGCSRTDRTFVLAACTYQKALEHELKARNLITFDEIFHLFGNRNSPVYEGLYSGALSKVEHLLIDEFQDVSPNLINFINTLKEKHIEVSERLIGSLMCVGDDYQSIYGWRGSSPKFIIHFGNFFHVPDGYRELKLIDNYRSAEVILDNAAMCTDKLTSSSKKSYIVAGENKNFKDAGFQIYPEKTITASQSKTQVDYELLIQVIEREVVHSKATKEAPVFVLYRSRKLVGKQNSPKLHAVLNKYKKSGEVKVLSIHTSKGLEAEAVIIVGDINYSMTNHVKNAIYKCCASDKDPTIGITYDSAQLEEAYRLGYVAITRAKRRVLWFLDSRKYSPSLGAMYCEKYGHGG